MTTVWEEVQLRLSNGQDCAIRITGPENAPPLLALHGWQDNAASFEMLAPLLPGYRIVALDFPGHGLSAPRPLSSPYYIWSYITEIRGVVEHFGWQQFELLGHSMGGAVALLYAALYPQELKKMVLLDSVGPLTTEPAKLPEQMKTALVELESLKARQRNYYRDFDTAVRARAEKGVSLEAATAFGKRGIVCEEKGCYWNLDPRLRVLNPLSLSEEQVKAFMVQIACPLLIILAPGFWEQKVHRQQMLRDRLAYLQNVTVHKLQGGHHQHMEAEAPAIAALIRRFLA